MIFNGMKHLGLFATLCAAVAFSSCGKRQAAAPPKPVRPVTVATVEARDVPIYLDEIGNCTAFETVMIQPQVSGPITEIHFTDGVEVKKGDPLFTIDPRPYQAALDRAKATLEQDRAKHDNDKALLKRNTELSQTRVISPQDLDNARAASQASAAAVQADEAAVEQAQINLDYCFIKAPIEGRTSKRAVDIGNLVAPMSTQLLLIQRQDPIYVDFTIPEGALPRVRRFIESKTLKVEASFADDPTKSRVGEFNFLDSGVQSNSGTVRMRAIMENNNRLFWPGQFVKVRMLLDTQKDAVLVPGEAVQIGSNGPFVFVVKADSTVELRPVKTGQPQGNQTVIAEGVQPGETVVVTGQIALAPGTQVNVVQSTPKAEKK